MRRPSRLALLVLPLRAAPLLAAPLLAVALLATVLLAGCSNGKPAASASPTVAARASAGVNCPDFADNGGTAVYFGLNGGTDLAGVVFGTGTTGIVFSHEADDTSCDWLPNAVALAKQGYRTLIYDFSGFGSSALHKDPFDQDVLAAAQFLTRQGATRLVLAAAAQLPPQPIAVVALSAPTAFGGVSAVDVVGKITAPTLLMAGSFDGSFADDARQLDAGLTASTHKQLLLVDSGLHGFRLVQPEGVNAPPAIAAFAAFLQQYAPPA